MKEVFTIQKAQDIILSRYPQETLVERLASYNSTDALVVIDVDDSVRDSPGKRMAVHGLMNPSLFIDNFDWGVYTGAIVLDELLNRGNIKDVETASFAYYRDNVFGKLSRDQRKKLAEKSLTPLYSGVQEFVGYFSDALKIIVSRNISEIVDKTVQELGCASGRSEQDNKKVEVLHLAEIYQSQRVLIIGDSKEDAAAIPDLKARGVPIDFVYVMKRDNPRKMHQDATVGVTNRNFLPLYKLISQ